MPLNFDICKLRPIIVMSIFTVDQLHVNVQLAAVTGRAAITVRPNQLVVLICHIKMSCEKILRLSVQENKSAVASLIFFS